MIEKTMVSDAQRDVWAWKHALNENVAHLPRREALRTLLGNAKKAMNSAGVCLPEMQSSHSRLVVAEDHPPYEIRK